MEATRSSNFVVKVNPILRWIKNRIKANKNAILVINGATGSGKSYAGISLALKIAETLGTNFDIHNNMDFNFINLLKKMMLPHNKKPGTIFLFEEVGSFGSGSSSREWQSQANKFFFSFMQTSRHRNQILIFTCPHFSYLERGTRMLVHMQLEMDGIDLKKKIAFLKPYRVQVNSRSGQFYFKYLRCKGPKGKFKFKRLIVPCPPDDIVKEYERLKTLFTGKLNSEIIRQSKEQVEEDMRGKKAKVNDKAMAKLLKKGLSNSEIAKVMGICTKTVLRHKKKIAQETAKGSSTDNKHTI